MNPTPSLIRTGDDPILRQVCQPVAFEENIDDLRKSMEFACKRSRIGVGIAAPQVGVAKRVIFTIVPDLAGNVRGVFYVNPVVVRKSHETNVRSEACLSYPGRQKMIRRHEWIELEYQLWSGGGVQRKTFHDYKARVIQHELDHLDGVCRVGDDSEADSELPRGETAVSLAPTVRMKPRPSSLNLLAVTAMLAMGGVAGRSRF